MLLGHCRIGQSAPSWQSFGQGAQVPTLKNPLTGLVRICWTLEMEERIMGLDLIWDLLCFFSFVLFFQSGALFLATCYILEQKAVICWSLELKFAICTVHRCLHGFSRFFHSVHWFVQSVHRCSIVAIGLPWVQLIVPWFQWMFPCITYSWWTWWTCTWSIKTLSRVGIRCV